MQLEIALRLLIENDFKKQTVGENSFVSIEIPQQTTTVDKKIVLFLWKYHYKQQTSVKRMLAKTFCSYETPPKPTQCWRKHFVQMGTTTSNTDVLIQLESKSVLRRSFPCSWFKVIKWTKNKCTIVTRKGVAPVFVSPRAGGNDNAISR